MHIFQKPLKEFRDPEVRATGLHMPWKHQRSIYHFCKLLFKKKVLNFGIFQIRNVLKALRNNSQSIAHTISQALRVLKFETNVNKVCLHRSDKAFLPKSDMDDGRHSSPATSSNNRDPLA